MKYHKTILLKDGRECTLRNGTAEDAPGVLANFILTHEQTDYLSSYPDEITLTLEKEEEYLKKKEESERTIELIAVVDGRVVGTAGIDSVGSYEKVKHRASFGISIDREYWGLGMGRAMMKACIECARAAGYTQLELEVVAGNEKAYNMYKSEGFVEYGRNPRGFVSRLNGRQETVAMRLELDH